jgi:hypothetical protein
MMEGRDVVAGARYIRVVRGAGVIREQAMLPPVVRFLGHARNT